MKAIKRPRHGIDALRHLAGEKSFAHRPLPAMQVVILGIGPERALAHVAGTEDYRCGARQTAESTAKLNSAFCKQMVAVTLAANVIGSDVAADGDGTLGRIRDVAATLFSLPQSEAGS